MSRVFDRDINSANWPAETSGLKSPTYEYAWFSACADAFYQTSDQRLITIGNSERLQAVAPLYTVKKKGITWQEIMGVAKLHEPGGLIYADEQSLTLLCKSIVAERTPTLFGRLPAEDPSIGVFVKLATKRGFVLKIKNNGSPYVTITSSWDEYLSRLSSRRKQDYRRARRRLADQGEVSVDFYRPALEDLEPLLEEAFRVEQANWKGRNGSAINCRPDLKRFFVAYFKRLCESGKLIISALRLDGEMIAVQMLAERENRWWILKIGYDDRWAKYSPGMQLMFETVREAFERKLAGFEFLGAEEQWIDIWPHDTHDFTSLVYFPYNISGLGALIAEIGSKILSRLGITGILQISSNKEH
jgi:CelD/BcsL family acetyltransferase involved in cellulose biosynthesis